MSDAALRKDVIAALRAKDGVTVTELADGSVEIACVGEPPRRFPFKDTVSRGLLDQFERLYGVPKAAFYPPTSTKPVSNASGQ